jgi:hypothetical protein
MPPQGAVLAGALVWNFQRSLVGKTTISMLARRHPLVSAVALVGFNAWIWPHLYRPRTFVD